MSKHKILVWDLPTRLFHWLLTIGLTVCFLLSLGFAEHSLGFTSHMILGIVLGLMIVLRVAWGFVGSKYARFHSFLFSPQSVFQYFQDAIMRRDQPHVGHNPGSSYAIWAMLLLVLLCVVTGLLFPLLGETVEDLHAISSYVLIGIVVLHIAGVTWYSLRHNENITWSMVTGQKRGDPQDAIPSSHPLVAVFFLGLVGFVTFGLFQNYDDVLKQTKLPLINVAISLTEGAEVGEDADD